MFTEEQKTQLVERCKAGEGVNAIILSLGIPLDQGLEWLKKNYRAEMKEAKAIQRARQS